MKDIDILKIVSGVMIGIGSLLVLTSISSMSKGKKKVPNVVKTQVLPKGISLNERQRKIIKKFKDDGVVTISDVQKMFKGKTDRTLRRDLTDLVDKKILRKEGSTKASKYIFS